MNALQNWSRRLRHNFYYPLFLIAGVPRCWTWSRHMAPCWVGNRLIDDTHGRILATYCFLEDDPDVPCEVYLPFYQALWRGLRFFHWGIWRIECSFSFRWRVYLEADRARRSEAEDAPRIRASLESWLWE